MKKEGNKILNLLTFKEMKESIKVSKILKNIDEEHIVMETLKKVNFDKN